MHHNQPPHDQVERSATRSKDQPNRQTQKEKMPGKHLQNDLASRSHELTPTLNQPRASLLRTLVPRDRLQMHDVPSARRRIREVVSGKYQVDLDRVRRWQWRRGRTSLLCRVESLARRSRSMTEMRLFRRCMMWRTILSCRLIWRYQGFKSIYSSNWTSNSGYCPRSVRLACGAAQG